MPKDQNPLFTVHLLELELQQLLESYPDLADDEDLRADMIEGSTAAYDVLDRILTRYMEAETERSSYEARAERIKSRAAAASKRKDAMRRLALRLMTAGDLRSVKLPEGTLSRVKGRESVEVTDETSLPEWAFSVKVSKLPSKKAIGEALDAGIAVPGAQRVVGDETLQVR
jgi:hypothetical protein